MRYNLPPLSAPAWLAVLVLGFQHPVQAMIDPGNMVMLCTEHGVQWVPAPGKIPPQRDDGSPGACHALCQRKRTADGGSGDLCDEDEGLL